MSQIGIFVLFLCPLIFFHELGHFLFAKLFKVRIEVFSIGFGPKLFRFKRGDTEYALSLIPLGGYVKMYGDDLSRKDQVPEEERVHSFTHKSKWARFWIVFGGPLANFIFAYVIFYFLMVIGEKLPEARFSTITTDSKFYSLEVRPGDSLKKINGKEIVAVTDLPFAESEHVRSITIERKGKMKKVAVDLPVKEFVEEFLKNPPALQKPIVVNKEGKRFALSFSDSKIDWEHSLEEMSFEKGNLRIFIFGASKDGFKSRSARNLKFRSKGARSFFKKLSEFGFRDSSLTVKSVVMKSPADLAGLKSIDVIKSIDGVEVYNFNQLKEALQKTERKDVAVEIWRGGKTLIKSIAPDINEIEGKKVKRIGVHGTNDYIQFKMIRTAPKGLIISLWKSLVKTVEMTGKMVHGLKMLVTGQVSIKDVGGPILIGQAANDSLKVSISYFFQFMAIISINLALINLFPIPVLDGGHILFILLEVINRGPLSRRKMEIAQHIGLSMLLLLIFVTLFNDVSRLF